LEHEATDSKSNYLVPRMTPSIVLFRLSSVAPETDLEEAQSRIFLFVRLFPNVLRIIDAKLVLMLKQLDGMVVHSS